MLLGHKEQLLPKTTPSRLREIGIFPNTYRQTQRDRQNEKMEEYVPNQRTWQIPRKKDLNEMEISNLRNKEFKIMIITMLTDLRRRMEEHRQIYRKYKKESNRNYTKLKNTLEGFNSRMDEIQAQISELKDKAMENTQTEQQTEKRTLKSEEGTSLVAQWLRICLPMQGTRVQALVQEDPTCHRATKPLRHNY